ncbi:aspartic proteinase nepenthesin-2-like [Gastrolobium bilobum]|uniref:aspartic proteinase nepenthesin-2-like n=1 Tax=Gastrolobium bilobum TaxID=150636 RepID=UPI002AB32010|nr:aspartic proteinase nepenthesin-2-like [Gastrolobium bilobum]
MASISSMMCMIFLSLLSCQILASQSSSNGLSLELIHPYTLIKSPPSSIHNLSNGSDALQPDAITPPIVPKYNAFMLVKVGIGTFTGNPSYMSYLLVLDTGSSLTWVQCEGCAHKSKRSDRRHCYPQKNKLFSNSTSKSYRDLLDDKYKKQVPYTITYADGDNSTGVLAIETFTFPTGSSSSSRVESVKDVTFGCGLNNWDRNGDDRFKRIYVVAGAFGLGIYDGYGKYSIWKKLEPISGGRFSYCFVGYVEKPTPMYLRFGSEIKPPANLRTTKFLKSNYHGYRVALEGLGFEGKRLDIDPKVFAPAPSDEKPGGCVIDSGSTMSYIIKDAYEKLEEKVRSHFSSLKEFISYVDNDGAQLDVHPEGVFLREVDNQKKPPEETFCLMIQSDDKSTILGNFQQVNVKFIYDTKKQELQFGPEDCAQNG